ncbi:MAG: TIGR00159 family protein [Phycisphaerales bacterium]|nr:TIGR00159 family protein [Phycisphaerales bacterium]
MRLWTPIQDLLDRISAYPPYVVVAELLLIWLVVYGILRFVQGTRAAGALKGMLVVLIIAAVVSRVLGVTEAFQRISYLYERFVALVAVALVVIFQPELRRALVRLGETPFFRSTPSDIAYTVNEIAEASAFLSRARFGGLIVIERSVGLTGLLEGGTVLNSELSARLLQTIFFPGSALHDLAVIVRGRRIHAAGVQLPLADPSDMPDPRFGSRHRAAVGLTKECDALVVVISEETGGMRIAERGRLSAPMDEDQLRDELRARLTRAQKAAAAAAKQAAASAPDPAVGSDGHGATGEVDGQDPNSMAEHHPDAEDESRIARDLPPDEPRSDKEVA